MRRFGGVYRGFEPRVHVRTPGVQHGGSSMNLSGGLAYDWRSQSANARDVSFPSFVDETAGNQVTECSPRYMAALYLSSQALTLVELELQMLEADLTVSSLSLPPAACFFL